MPLPSEDSSSLPSGSNSLENSSDFCMTVGMPSSKSSTKVSTSNIRPPFNIANILSPQNETKTSSSRQSGDHIQITENNKYVQNTNPLLNYGESTSLEAQNVIETVSVSNHYSDCDDRIAGDSNDTHIAIDALFDAIRYRDAQVKLEQAEKTITDLIMKFSEPQDCSTPIDLSVRSSRRDEKGSDSVEANSPSDVVTQSSLLPILNLLKSQSDPKISLDLYKSSSYGKQLYDLYSPCLYDILRVREKLYILHKMRLRQSEENRTISITSESTSVLTITTSTASSSSSYKEALSPSKCSSHNPVTNTQNNLQNAFITCPNNVQKTNEIQESQTASTSHSLEQSTPPESRISEHESEEYEKDVDVTNLQSNDESTDIGQCTSQNYTNPFDSPLSLLSFVCELKRCEEKLRQESLMSSELSDSVIANTIELQSSQPEESSCSHNLSSLPSTSKTSPTRHHSGKRRQVSSPLEEHKRLNIESEFSQAPSKSRRGSSFRSPKSTVSRQHIDPLNSRAVSSTNRKPTTSQISRLSCSFPTITLHQSSNFSQQGKLNESGSNVELVNKIGIHGCSSSTPSVSPLSSSVPTRDSSVSYPTRLSDTFWWDSKRPVSSSTTGVDKFQQLSVDVQDHGFTRGDKDNQTGSFVVPRDDCRSSGGTNNRLSTPEIRRNEFDLSDLSDGTRVLVIKDTYLLPGTIYMERDHSPLAIQTSLSSDYLRDRIFRIQLDSEKCNRSTGPRVANDNHFTTSSHSNNTNGTSSRRQPSSLSPSNGCLQTPSTANNTNFCNTSPGSNRRRQMDLLLYGWQVVQQAVLEVFPDSIHHVPPGTRVCAAWSDKLGVNLYPGTVVEADSPEAVNHDHIPVDFDDGDHREVPLSGLRILPDSFTNLCELADITGGEPHTMNGLSPYLIPSNSGNCVRNAVVSRMRRHSGVDRNIRRLSYNSWSLSETPISLCSPQTSTNSIANSTSSLLDDTAYEPNPRVVRTKSFEICGYSTSSDITMRCNLDSGESVSNTICIPRTIKTPIISRGGNIGPWSILEKYKHRKRRCTYCRSIIRNVDGLVVELGDCVQLRSDRDELYLGKVREIRCNGEKHSPTVVTAWYYEPREAGVDGQLIQHVKGAVFATEHEDENGAECIIRLVKMAKSYGEFLQTCGRKLEEDKFLSIDKVPSTSIGEHLRYIQSSRSVDMDEISLPGDGDYGYDGDPTDVFDYFIAGKYDPVERKVTSWDLLLASELNLKLYKKRSNSYHNA